MTTTILPIDPPRPANRRYLAGTPPGEAPIQQWVDQFNRDGFLFIKSVLPPDLVAELKADLDRILEKEPDKGGSVIRLHMRMFEVSPANVKLFDLEPIVSFAEKAISPDCHVVHNNSFISLPDRG